MDSEVEMVDAVDDLETSQSIGGVDFLNFEMFGIRTSRISVNLAEIPSRRCSRV